MCFGNAQTQSTTSNQNYTPASYLSSAAQNNLNFASNLQSTGFTPYSGQQVAGFNPQQSQSFGMGTGIAGAVTPNVQLAGGALSSYLNNATNEPTVSPETISSQMSPYMSQYTSMALQPRHRLPRNASGARKFCSWTSSGRCAPAAMRRQHAWCAVALTHAHAWAAAHGR